ncbi:hypothetical protein SAMN06265171_101606 [Chryseobacterium rhizoplanae]|uniref:Uncharacterized protein n=1 Tax=Chryseobacterium rhizoplanae TaxID=1609531 RepID=A0A521B0I2_9FLAO|nr:hypothetical protein SAMN06265171_101606 [Chryseobacterium rhizoplanae]
MTNILASKLILFFNTQRKKYYFFINLIVERGVDLQNNGWF